MTSKVKGTEGIEFPDSTVQGSAAYSKAESIGQMFAARRATTQTVTSGTFAKILFTTEDLDVGGCFDMANSRFQPTKAGWYQINAAVSGTVTGDGSIIVQGMLNGVTLPWSITAQSQNAFTPSGVLSFLQYMNGTTNYLEVQARIAPGTVIDSGAAFSAFLVKAD